MPMMGISMASFPLFLLLHTSDQINLEDQSTPRSIPNNHTSFASITKPVNHSISIHHHDRHCHVQGLQAREGEARRQEAPEGGDEACPTRDPATSTVSEPRCPATTATTRPEPRFSATTATTILEPRLSATTATTTARVSDQNISHARPTSSNSRR